MKSSAHEFLADPPARPATTQAPIASWYAQGVSDGLGDRLLMFDNTDAASLELLRFRPSLANAPGFERTLREAVRRLASFKHDAFAQARSLRRLEGDDGLALISTHIEGKRLSDMFRRTHHHDGMHPGFATWLIRQLTSALSDFHAQGEDIAHGALTADRIVLTPDRRLVIIEHVLGEALDERRFSPERLWHDVGIIATPTVADAPRLDKRSDIVQLGLVTLSVLLGRPITPDDYPKNLERLLDEFAETSGKRSPTLVGPLRRWLIEALDPGAGFETAVEAGDSLRLPGHSGEHVALGAPPIIEQELAPVVRTFERPQVPPVQASGELHVSPVHTIEEPLVSPFQSIEESPVSPLQTIFLPETQVADMALSSSVGHAESLTAPTGTWADVPSIRRFSLVRNAAIGLAVFALLEGIVITRLMTTPTSAPVAAKDVPLTIQSPTPGDRVFIDGREVGVTPFQLSVALAPHAIQVLARQSVPAAPPAAPVVVSPPNDARTASALAAATQRQRSGGLRLTTPIELQVLEGERVLGSSVDGPIVASAGVHQLDFINTAIGYRSRQTVTIKAGEIIPLKVQPPDGRVSINAQPWAQVWIDGSLVGETPLANLTVSPGEHEIIFRHPQLGEHREKTIVKSGVQTRVSATLSK
jgi:serine/threonine protein kinase